MITVKDIIDLQPYSNIYIKNADFVSVYNHPEDYIVSDMKSLCDNFGIELLVYPKDGFSFKYDKHGDMSTELGIAECFKNAVFKIDDIEEDE